MALFQALGRNSNECTVTHLTGTLLLVLSGHHPVLGMWLKSSLARISLVLASAVVCCCTQHWEWVLGFVSLQFTSVGSNHWNTLEFLKTLQRIRMPCSFEPGTVIIQFSCVVSFRVSPCSLLFLFGKFSSCFPFLVFGLVGLVFWFLYKLLESVSPGRVLSRMTCCATMHDHIDGNCMTHSEDCRVYLPHPQC